LGRRRPREDAAAERRRVERGHAERLGLREQRLGRPVDQRVAIVREHDGEGARADVSAQEVDRPARDAEMSDQPLLLERLHGRQRPAGGDARLEGDVLGVVEMDEPEPVEPEPLEALVDRAPDPVAREVPRGHVAIDLRLEHEAIRDAPALAQDDPDAPLGVAVVVAGVEEVDRAVQRVPHGRQRVLERHLVGVGARVAERRGADTERRDLEAGAAQHAPREHTAAAHIRSVADSLGLKT
jgi:hypothetical protein